MSGKYDDIIGLSRPVSARHIPMSRYDRAAQFSPFAALTGYDGVIEETARLTDRQVELDEGGKAELDEKLREIQEHIADMPQITVTYFREDGRKDGGAYITVSGRVKKIDQYSQTLVFMDGSGIDIGQIYQIL